MARAKKINRAALKVAGGSWRGRPTHDDRRFVEGMLWVLRTGSPWRDLPERFGRWASMYTRWRRWAQIGLWARLLRQLAWAHDAEAYMLDGMYTRVHAHRANPAGDQCAQALGRSKGGLTTKLHMLCDALGNPVRFVLTGGGRQDSTQATALLRDCRNAWVLADKAYDADALRAYLRAGGNTAVNRPKPAAPPSLPSMPISTAPAISSETSFAASSPAAASPLATTKPRAPSPPSFPLPASSTGSGDFEDTP